MRRLLILALLATGCGSDESSPGAPGGSSSGGGAGVATGGASGAGGAGTGGDAGAAGTAGVGAGYAAATFLASHNSYSPGADLGPVKAQLDAGVRFLEFDIHDNDFAAQGFRVGHDAPGDEVSLGGDNPSGLGLPAWLQVVADWTKQNAGHAPITIGIDLKDPLDDNPSHAAGNLAALNDVIQTAFGSALYSASQAPSSLPALDAMRDRVVVVLSGHYKSRQAYRRDEGKNPSIALNSKGQLLEIHDSGGGDLWYWTGSLASSKARFARHTKYDTGKNPAVLLDDSGVVVEVHEHQSTSQLFYRVGQLTGDLEVTWHGSAGNPFPGNDNGQNPSLAWVNEGSTLREVHKSQNNSQHWYWDGALNAAKTDITWTRKSADGGKTSDPLYDKTTATSGADSVKVSTGAHGPFTGDVLLVSLNGGALQRVRYEQSMFTEVQWGNSDLEKDDPWFFAADARNPTTSAWAAGWTASGKLSRLWAFNDVKHATIPATNFAATDEPLASWYKNYCAGVGCVAP